MAAGYITIGALYLIAIISGWGSLPTSSLLLLTGLMGAFTLGHRFAPEPEEFEATTALPVEFKVEGEERRLSPAAELTLYRATQEALTNVQKHAHASRVELALSFAPHEVTLTVADNGVWPEAAALLGFAALFFLVGVWRFRFN